MSKPVISVIIITKNDLGVEDTLESMKNVRKPAETELIVVDASNPPDRLAHIRVNYPEVKWVMYDGSKSPKASFPEQRNLGAATASGEYLVWLDCSCTPNADWLEKMYESLQTPKVIMSSRIIAKGRASVFEIDPRLLKEPMIERLEAAGIGMGFTRKSFDEVGGFDNRFSFAEDVDFTWTARRLGYKIFLNTEAIVAHDWEDWQKEIRRSYKYGASRAKLYKKHTWLWYQLFGYDLNVIVYPLFILGLPLTYFFPYYPLILLIPFIKNIRRKPCLVLAKNLIFAWGVLRGVCSPGYAV